jgi:DNA-directed RNA polymerase I, II, and III subunit RPABC2
MVCKKYSKSENSDDIDIHINSCSESDSEYDSDYSSNSSTTNTSTDDDSDDLSNFDSDDDTNTQDGGDEYTNTQDGGDNKQDNSGYESDDSEIYDDFQKLKPMSNDDYINNLHPECISHNFDEVKRMTTIIRNDDNIIIDKLHKTLPQLSKYEKTRILGQRASQIDNGSNIFVNVAQNIIDSYDIAVEELNQRKIPFIIKRPLPNGGCEYWNVQDLEII